VPYRRGYLLYGPPGTGKTTFINSIAGELKLNLCVLSLQDEEITECKLINALGTIPNRSLVLLEDVDAIFN
jgi:chaperone BCS1